MKKTLATVLTLLMIPVVLAGCSNSSRQGQSKSSSSSSSQTAASNNSKSSSTAVDNQTGRQALKVRYEDRSFTSYLDHEYYEEHLYKYVPGTVDRNKTYSWDAQNVSTKTKAYVDKRAVATFKDEDDHETEHETFFRIQLGSKTGQKYWVNEDALQDDHENDLDD